MLVKEKFYRFGLIKILNIIFFTFFFYLSFVNSSQDQKTGSGGQLVISTATIPFCAVGLPSVALQ